jgi:ABC-2 type transport system permease protein
LDPNRSTVAAATVAGYVAQASEAIAAERLALLGKTAPRGGLELRPRIWFNPQLDTPPYMIPGVMAMLLVVVTTIVTAMGLAREREMGTLEQVLVTPISPMVLLVGKMLPFVAIGIFDVIFALTIGTWLFALPVRGSLVVVAVASLLTS